MRISEFRRLVAEEFGRANGEVYASTLSLPGLGRTADQALADGMDPKEVWQALCQLQDVPEARRLGRDIPPKA